MAPLVGKKNLLLDHFGKLCSWLFINHLIYRQKF